MYSYFVFYIILNDTVDVLYDCQFPNILMSQTEQVRRLNKLTIFNTLKLYKKK